MSRPQITIEDARRFLEETLAKHANKPKTNQSWLDERGIPEDFIKSMMEASKVMFALGIMAGDHVDASVMETSLVLFQLGWDMATEFAEVTHVGHSKD